ncbi:MAG: preprotein translocase subunit SecY [Maribacter sp.]
MIADLWLKKTIGGKSLLALNVLSLLLVLFIFANGILSSELPIQMFGFEQLNKALNYFPFILLPATVIPIIIYTHLTDIITLLKKPT